MERREAAALTSVICNILLVILKLIGASLSGSIAMVADAWHSMSDIAVSILVWVGVRFSRSERAPRKAVGLMENGIVLIVAIAIFFAALNISRKALGVMVHDVRRIPIAMGITMACIFISLFISRYKDHVGRETRSPSLVADGQHSRMDMYTSIAVLVVLIGEMVGVSFDRITAVCISLAIAGVGVEVLSIAVEGFKKGSGPLFCARPAPGGVGTLRLPGVAARYLARASGSFWKRRRLVAFIIFALACVYYLRTSVSVVNPAERGLLRRFGRFAGEVRMPGIYLHLPYPMETMVKVYADRIERLEFGFRSLPGKLMPEGREEPYEWESRHRGGAYRKVLDEALILTGDENVIDLNMILHYSISDIRKYLTNVSDVESLLRAAAESSMARVVGQEKMDSLLTNERAGVQELIRNAVQERLDCMGAGVEIIRISLQDVHPPIEVVRAFRDVASAREDKERMINMAQAQHNESIPKARGAAAYDIADAESFGISIAKTARGDSDYYLSILNAYALSTDVTHFRLMWETLEKVLRPVEKYFFQPDAVEEGTQLWLLQMGSGQEPLENVVKGMEK